jgi:hypothetical protein
MKKGEVKKVAEIKSSKTPNRRGKGETLSLGEILPRSHPVSLVKRS